MAVLILYLFATVLNMALRDSEAVRAVAMILAALAGFFLLWGYYVVFEIVWNGQTPGKRALGLRVIRENGYPLRPGDAVVRNLIRIVDGPPLGAVVGSLVMLCNDRAKRIGDFAAGTIVVREGKRQRLGELGHIGQVGQLGQSSQSGQSNQIRPPDQPATAAGAPNVSSVSSAPGTPGTAAVMPSLSADDATLVRDFLVRRAEMYPDARRDLAQRLADHLCRRYGLPSPERGRAERLLESLASE